MKIRVKCMDCGKEREAIIAHGREPPKRCKVCANLVSPWHQSFSAARRRLNSVQRSESSRSPRKPSVRGSSPKVSPKSS